MSHPGTSRPPGPLGSPRVVADWTGLDPDALDALIRSGAIRATRFGRGLFIDLDDAERAAKDRNQGGGRP